MKSFKEWWNRKMYPVQVGDVWEYKSNDPYNPIHFIDEVLSVSGEYVQYERQYVNLGSKDIQSDHMFWFTRPSRKLISEKQ